MASLAVWLPGPMFLHGRFRGVSVHWVLCLRVFLQAGSLSPPVPQAAGASLRHLTKVPGGGDRL